jgi:hypothetical protein
VKIAVLMLGAVGLLGSGLAVRAQTGAATAAFSCSCSRTPLPSGASDGLAQTSDFLMSARFAAANLSRASANAPRVSLREIADFRRRSLRQPVRVVFANAY